MGANDGAANQKPVHRVTVAEFEIDRTEVTVKSYTACVKAGGCTPTSSWGKCNAGAVGKENHPINCLDWFRAKAFCHWAGRRLPTEEEWEYAARGTDGRRFPWGDSKPGPQLCWEARPGTEGTCPVGTYPKGNSPFGLLDMSGNVREWTSSYYSEEYTAKRSSFIRVVRGGSWFSEDLAHGRASSRDGIDPCLSFDYLGLRCARSLTTESD
jgi:formylglycine-generating enzyme required for sulfatase activity